MSSKIVLCIVLMLLVAPVVFANVEIHVSVDENGVATLDSGVPESAYRYVGIADSRTSHYQSAVLATVTLSFGAAKNPQPVTIYIDAPFHTYLSDSLHLGFTQGQSTVMPVLPRDDFNLVIHFLQKSASANFTKYNDFTIIGKPKDVEKTKQALIDMPWLAEYYENLTGIKKLPPITIFTSEYTSTATEKGFMYEPNVIFLDRIQVANRGEPNLQALLLHEIMHVYERKITWQPDDNRGWIDEGLAEFANEYAMDNFILPQQYTTFTKYGNTFIDQDYYNRPSLKTLKELQGNRRFSLYWSAGDGYTTSIYGLAPLIFQRVFEEKGFEGIRSFLMQVGKIDTGKTCTDCVGVVAYDMLQNISGLHNDDLMYPYMNQPEQLLRYAQRNLTRAERKEILAKASTKN